MRREIDTVCLGLLLFFGALPAHAHTLDGPKLRLSVSTFKDKSGGSHPYWTNVGDGMADMLTTALGKTGKFIVLERQSLRAALDEQSLAASGEVQSQTGAKKGGLIGAGYLVTGSISEFGIKNSTLGVGELGRLLPIGGGASLQTETARVALDLRIFDTTTGQVIATEQAVGTKASRHVNADIDQAPTVEFGKDGFDETIIGQATREAIEKAAALVEDHMEHRPWYGRVVKVADGSVYINTGAEDDRQVGDTFRASREGEVMTDPDTGEALGAKKTALGQIRITSVIGKRLSEAEAVGSVDLKPGDLIE